MKSNSLHQMMCAKRDIEKSGARVKRWKLTLEQLLELPDITEPSPMFIEDVRAGKVQYFGARLIERV